MEHSSVKTLSTRQGKPMLSVDGYLFTVNTIADFKKLWECQSRRVTACPARLHTDIKDGEILKRVGTHNHEPNPIQVERTIYTRKIVQEAKETRYTPSQIIASNVQKLSAAAKCTLPLVSIMKRTVRHARSVTGESYTIPKKREDIDLPESYRVDEGGNKFLLYDSGPDADRILIFGTEANLRFLGTCNIWLADGTFKVSPPLFDQLFVIHGYKRKNSFPLLYALTPNRTTATYTRMLEAIKALVPSLTPKVIMSDFERASINAFAKAFPLAEQKGCFFHFSQCIFRKIQSLSDVHARYSTDSDFTFEIRKLFALSFVPPEDTVAVFDILMMEDFFEKNETLLAELIAYFETAWVGAMNRRRTTRNAPLYSVDLWNCYYSVLDETPRTNNCEAFNNGIFSILGAAHPTIYKLIDGLKAKQALTDTAIQQLYNNVCETPNRDYVTASEKLKNVVSTYGEGCVTEYLHSVAYSLIRKNH